MARYVLVEFENDKDAEEFAGAIERGQKIVYPVPHPEEEGEYNVHSPSGNYRVRALFAKPTKFCECTLGADEEPVSARGKKWGWWVHRKCGRPRKGNCQHPRNLLEHEDMDRRRRNLYIGVYEPELPPGDPDRKSVV